LELPLSGNKKKNGSSESSTTQGATTEVKALKAEQVPARHAKKITGHTEKNLGEKTYFWTLYRGI